MVRGSHLHPTRGTLPKRPVLQYSKAQNRQQDGTPAQFRLRIPPNAVPIAGSATQLSRSVPSVQGLNAQIDKPGQSSPQLVVPSATLRMEYCKPLSSSSPGPSTLASTNTPLKQEPVDTLQVWAEAGLVTNNILSSEVDLGTDTMVLKREVLEEESALPVGCKRLKLESKGLEAEQLLDYKDGSYLVKWTGMAKEQSTWEAADNLNCAQLIHQFHTSKSE